MVSNHDELMCNFFAQADALATGKTPVELRAENVPDSLIPHKTFTGNRPSTSLLLPELTAFTTGQILSLYENRIAVQARLSPRAATAAAWRLGRNARAAGGAPSFAAGAKLGGAPFGAAC